MGNLSIRSKIVLLAGLSMSGVAAVVVAVNLYQTGQSSELVAAASKQALGDKVQQLLQARTAEKALLIKQTFGDSLLVLNGVADQVSDIDHLGLSPQALREALGQSLKTAFERNPAAVNMWLVLKPNALDGKDASFVNDSSRGANENGRFASYWSRAQGQIEHAVIDDATLGKADVSASGVAANAWYACPYTTGSTCLMEPFSDVSAGKQVLITTLSVPVRVKNKVVGAAGIDISIDLLQSSVERSQHDLFEGAGRVLIVSGSGVIAADSRDASNTAQPLSAALGSGAQAVQQVIHRLIPQIDKQDEMIRSTYPVAPLQGLAPWGVIIDLPENVLLADSQRLQGILDQAQTEGTVKSMVLAGLAGLIGLLVIWLTATGVTRPINSVAHMLKDIASGDGDLSQRLRYARHDELGELVGWFNRFLDKLQPTIAQIKVSITDARATADHSSVIALRTSEGMQVQFREIDQVATASNEMSATAQDVANSAAHAASAAQRADHSAKEGLSLIERSTVDIEHLVTEVSRAVSEVESLAVSSDQIGGVLEVIRSIAEQTNLLALNAAIEAARAGESGRGFAVVADEVRNLARRTQDSIEEIRDVVERIQSGTRVVVATMHQSQSIALANARQIQNAVQVLGRIGNAVTIISDMNLQIASAAEEQSAVAEEVNRNVSAIRVVTEALTSQATESAQISSQLNSLASQQMRLMDPFKV